MKTYLKKLCLVVVACFVFVTLFAGCSGTKKQTDSSGEANTSDPKEQQEQVEETVYKLGYFSNQYDSTYQKAIEGIEKAVPGVKMELVFYPTDKDAILMDIGGTTTDISFLADGVPLFEPLGIKIGSYNTLVRAIYSVSIGLGGDSAVCVKDGKLKIGPVRKGMPRALGGPVPTPSDAMIVLGLMEFGDRNRALEAIQEIGQEMGVSAQTAAQMIYDTMGQMIKDEVERLLKEINSRPVYTIKELLYGKKVKPEFLSVIGGPAKAIAPILEKKFELPCKVPPYYEAANAVGAALAKITAEVTLVADTAEGIIAVPEIGLHEKTPRNFDIKKAREKAFEALKVKALELGADESEIAPEIVEEQCYNVVRGFYTRGKNIRIKAQLKPGFNPNFKGFEV